MPQWFTKCKTVPWQPPNIVFKIVWPLLYTLYVTVIVLERNNPQTTFYLLLGLLANLCWVPTFIYNTRLALLLLVAMILIGLKTMGLLFAADRNANRSGFRSRALLFSPYLSWIGFALSLNLYLAFSCV